MTDKYIRPYAQISEYLDRTGIAANLQEALIHILENKPDDPVAFLSEYFRQAYTDDGDLTTVRKNLMFVHHSRPTFLDHITKIYRTLVKFEPGIDGSFNGKKYNYLLELIIKEIPASIKNKLLSRLIVDNDSIIIFDVFYWGIYTCLVFLDYYEETRKLYEIIDVTNEGKIDMTLCNRLMDRLKASNELIFSNPESIIKVAELWNVTTITGVLNEVSVKPESYNKVRTMTKQEFIGNLCELFFEQIRSTSV